MRNSVGETKLKDLDVGIIIDRLLEESGICVSINHL